MDLILGAFADRHAEALSPADAAAFEALLNAPDQEVYAWILGAEPPAPAHDTPLLARIQAFVAEGGAEIARS
jgi:antitoxin CptB